MLQNDKFEHGVWMPDEKVAHVFAQARDQFSGEESSEELKKKYIQHKPDKDEPDKPWAIVGKTSGRVLGRFPSEEAARAGWNETMKRIHTNE